MVKITGVKINNTDNDIEITLETTNAKDLQPVGKNEDNNFFYLRISLMTNYN